MWGSRHLHPCDLVRILNAVLIIGRSSRHRHHLAVCIWVQQGVGRLGGGAHLGLQGRGLPTSLFNNQSHKGLWNSSDPHSAAGPPSVTPTKIPAPVRLSEPNEGTSGDISPHSSNWVWWLEPGLVIFNWGPSFWKETVRGSCLSICCLQVQSGTAVGNPQELTPFSTLLHCHSELSD